MSQLLKMAQLYWNLAGQLIAVKTQNMQVC